ncbi:YgaP family membrane protein [Alteromonas flava]|uniref:YgaP family membrane protein n=1 Tax=Alteromonas flava TaxID=2048003 RepID=UPI000C287182|nr:DUF2892 domain-containing protein [Alteromonas flava]
MRPKINLCFADRMIRGVISVVAIGYGVFFGDDIGDLLLQTLVIIFGVLNLISFAVGWCPVYGMANISTCKEHME